MLERRGTLRYGAERRIEQFGNQELCSLQASGLSRTEGTTSLLLSPPPPSSPRLLLREAQPRVGWRRSSSAGVATTSTAARGGGAIPRAGMQKAEEPQVFSKHLRKKSFDGFSDLDEVLRATTGTRARPSAAGAAWPAPPAGPVPPVPAAAAGETRGEEGGWEGEATTEDILQGWTHGAAAAAARGREGAAGLSDQQQVEEELGRALSFAAADEGPPELRLLRRADTFAQPDEDLMSSETTYVAMLREELWQALSAHVALGRREKVEAALNCLEQVEWFWGVEGMQKVREVRELAKDNKLDSAGALISAVTASMSSVTGSMQGRQHCFYVLVVVPPYSFRSSDYRVNLAAELRRLSAKETGDSPLVYRIVEVDSVRRALLATIVNPDILAVVVQDNVPVDKHPSTLPPVPSLQQQQQQQQAPATRRRGGGSPQPQQQQQVWAQGSADAPGAGSAASDAWQQQQQHWQQQQQQAQQQWQWQEQQQRHALRGFEGFVRGIDMFVEQPVMKMRAGAPILPTLVRAISQCRGNVDIFCVCTAMGLASLESVSHLVKRAFFPNDDHSALHEALLAGVKSKMRCPFFEALQGYAQRPIGVFHALAISRGNSVRRSKWIQGLIDFYGVNLFKAESSATCGGLDSLLDPHGSLLEAQTLAARAFDSSYAFFVTNGTSTSNKIVLQALLRPGDVVLVDRDCHKSHHYGFVLAGCWPCYLEAYPLHRYSMYGGVSLAEIKRALLAYRAAGRLHQVKLLVLTNCTFDGIVYNVRRVIEECLAIKPDLVFLFDEAWYSYATFHPILRRRTAMNAANDIRRWLSEGKYDGPYRALCRSLATTSLEAVSAEKLISSRLYPDPAALLRVRVYATHSVHKSLTSLRQGSLILVNDDLFESHVHASFKEAYYTHMSTSPNYQILATIDVGRSQMELEGYGLVEKQIEAALFIRRLLTRDPLIKRYFSVLSPRDMIPPGMRLHSRKIFVDEALQGEMNVRTLELTWLSDDEFVLDPTRITLFTGNSGLDGDTFKVKWLMDKYGIQINKTSRNSVLFMTNIGTTRSSCVFLKACIRSCAQELEMHRLLSSARELEEMLQARKALVEDCPDLPDFSCFHPAFTVHEDSPFSARAAHTGPAAAAATGEEEEENGVEEDEHAGGRGPPPSAGRGRAGRRKKKEEAAAAAAGRTAAGDAAAAAAAGTQEKGRRAAEEGQEEEVEGEGREQMAAETTPGGREGRGRKSRGEWAGGLPPARYRVNSSGGTTGAPEEQSTSTTDENHRLQHHQQDTRGFDWRGGRGEGEEGAAAGGRARGENGAAAAAAEEGEGRGRNDRTNKEEEEKEEGEKDEEEEAEKRGNAEEGRFDQSGGPPNGGEEQERGRREAKEARELQKFVRDGDIRAAFYLAYDEENVHYYTLQEARDKIKRNEEQLVSTSFVIPYPPGFPVAVPGQILTVSLIDFLMKLDVKEVHGYDAKLGLRCFNQEILLEALGERKKNVFDFYIKRSFTKPLSLGVE